MSEKFRAQRISIRALMVLYRLFFFSRTTKEKHPGAFVVIIRLSQCDLTFRSPCPETVYASRSGTTARNHGIIHWLTSAPEMKGHHFLSSICTAGAKAVGKETISTEQKKDRKKSGSKTNRVFFGLFFFVVGGGGGGGRTPWPVAYISFLAAGKIEVPQLKRLEARGLDRSKLPASTVYGTGRPLG